MSIVGSQKTASVGGKSFLHEQREAILSLAKEDRALALELCRLLGEKLQALKTNDQAKWREILEQEKALLARIKD